MMDTTPMLPLPHVLNVVLDLMPPFQLKVQPNVTSVLLVVIKGQVDKPNVSSVHPAVLLPPVE
jgi:hypothetical protein